MSHIEENAVTPSSVLVRDGRVHSTVSYAQKLEAREGTKVDGKKSFTLGPGESLPYTAGSGKPIVIVPAEDLSDEQKNVVDTAVVKAKHDVAE